MSTPPPAETRRIHPLTIWIPIIAIVGGIVVAYSYLVKLSMEKRQDRLPVLSRLEKDLTLVERSGKTVELSQLKGKVIVACWVYTHCPRGCAGVVSAMLDVHKDYENNPDVHFLSVSVDPDDGAEQLKTFADGLKIGGDNWWFVNGPKDVLRSYMTRYFGFMAVQDIPEKDRLSPADKYMHDMKVALVDKQGRVRGHYDISNPDPQQNEFINAKFREDMKRVLAETQSSNNMAMGIILLSVMGISVLSLLIMAWKRPPGRPAPSDPATAP
ncbi:cytochrome oxidase Cu insertion factor (SCO1/SenC/PrrC family) [Roseimicrobium gellanilyticum]|uniref:Cytochrome oxidase Cu insertion factor (SCO1/SenC/PrrC family) n=1 Tax=Roseimicrobium gellanilyticum TaxID=748857 RepID=A0A366HW44_9BACT|nr:SCO family protein [Roseimicrobium gellanilyticum]RBP47508.1 cytochrome oxidase Cu insertion factor (SCO1/SenC/PrrC family) [Roseimicrobium gellanilyticum]